MTTPAPPPGQYGPELLIDNALGRAAAGATVTGPAGYTAVVDILGNVTITGPASDAAVTFTVTPLTGPTFTFSVPIPLDTGAAITAAQQAAAAATPATVAAAVAASEAAARQTYVAGALHGSDTSFARPDASVVLWVGTVEPTNALASDVVFVNDGTPAPATPTGSPPGQVTNLMLTPAPGQIAANWTAPNVTGTSPITDYEVFFRAAGGSFAPFSDGTSPTTSATITGLTNGTTYEVYVRAVSADGPGPFSTIMSATPTMAATAPGQVTALTATPGSSEVLLSWSVPSTGGSPITDYVIQMRTGGAAFTTVADGISTATTYVVTGLVNNTVYDFQVAAANSVGQGLFSAPATTSPGAVIFNDEFTRADMVGLTTAPTGQTWVGSETGYRILNNTAQVLGSAGPSRIAFVPSSAAGNRGAISGRLRVGPEGAGIGLLFRAASVQTWLVFRVDLASDTAAFIKSDVNVVTVLATTPFDVVAASTYDFLVTHTATTLTGYINGVAVLTHTLSAEDQTRYDTLSGVGLRGSLTVNNGAGPVIFDMQARA